ncbi:MAG: long-chain fatty acid--CoA ligase [Flavobacteriales bacterium]|nr:long-chain fatty acid--CoA ligase [Flavobacteriales bacterium]
MNITRNFDLLDNLLESYTKPVAIAGKRTGSWKEYSTEEYVSIVNNISYGLLEIGINKEDKIAIISFNRPEWNFADFGASQLGAVTVPMYPTIGEADYKHILNDAGVKVILVENIEIYSKVAAIKNQVSSLEKIYSFDHIPGLPQWTELCELGKKNPNSEKVKALKDSVKSDDLMTLIYTSGTTGTPKGVMLTHNNILSNVRGAQKVCPVNHTHKVLSFLPLCHIFERMICYLYHYVGAGIYYAENMDTIGDNLKEVQPYAFSTVPRLLEKVYDKIIAKGHDLTGIKKSLFFWAVDLGLKYELGNKNGWWYNQQLKIADKLIFSKWREALGGHVGVIVSGAAALQPRLARIFTAAKINVLEGYGLTETSPVITVNRMEHENRMFGSVGLPIEDVEVKIAEDGEILCKGPNIMIGYYNLPDATKEVIDEQNWFHTGDVGRMEGKFLIITDRKKEVFKTSGGKYIAPQVMENKFKESPFIEQIMVIGENEKHSAALIVPAWDYLKQWCEKNGITWGDKEKIILNPQVLHVYLEEINHYNKGFGDWETIKKFELIPGEWSIEGGEMTPTLKLKRKPILAKYSALVERIYRS